MQFSTLMVLFNRDDDQPLDGGEGEGEGGGGKGIEESYLQVPPYTVTCFISSS